MGQILENIGSYGDNIVSYDGNVNLLTERTDPGFNMVAQLDNLFSLSTVLTAAFIGYWTVMRYLPPRPASRSTVKRDAKYPLDFEEILKIDEKISLPDFFGEGKILEY